MTNDDTLSTIDALAGVDTKASNGSQAGKPVECGGYDIVVRVTRGSHKGRIGYLDDAITEKSGAVYFGVPLLGAYARIPYRYMVYATDKEIEDYNMHGNGEFARRREVQRVRENRLVSKTFDQDSDGDWPKIEVPEGCVLTYAGYFVQPEEVFTRIVERIDARSVVAFRTWLTMAEAGDWIICHTQGKEWPVVITCVKNRGASVDALK